MDGYNMFTDLVAKIQSTTMLRLYPIIGTIEKKDLVVSRMGFSDNGVNVLERTLWDFAGYDESNTEEIDSEDGLRQRLFIVVATDVLDIKVSVYKDESMAELVAEGAVVKTVGGEVTLAEENTSGLSGVVTLIANATDETFTLDIEPYYAKYDCDVDAAADNIEGIYYEDGEPLGSDDKPEFGMVMIIQKCDGMNIDKLGVVNMTSAFKRKTLTVNCRAKGLFV